MDTLRLTLSAVLSPGGGCSGREFPLAALVEAVVQMGGVHEVLQMLRKHHTAQVGPSVPGHIPYL